MTTRAPWRILFGITALAGGAAFVLALEIRRAHQPVPRSWDFQRIVGGLGMGPTVTLHDCEASFDPRLAPDWRSGHLPLVGSEYYCPRHASSIFPLRSLDQYSDAEDFDAGVP